MKKLHILLLMLILSCSSSLLDAREAVDLAGTWEGPTYAEGAGIELILTLVLKHEGDGISGTITDDQGFIDCEIEEASLDNDVIKFKALAVTPAGDLLVDFELKVTESTMEGEWQAEDGTSGIWNPAKK